MFLSRPVDGFLSYHLKWQFFKKGDQENQENLVAPAKIHMQERKRLLPQEADYVGSSTREAGGIEVNRRGQPLHWPNIQCKTTSQPHRSGLPRSGLYVHL